jgi:hypothetical protein
MAIRPTCNACQLELSEPGALLFSPPNMEQEVMKLHLCVKCFEKVMDVLKSWVSTG